MGVILGVETTDKESIGNEARPYREGYGGCLRNGKNLPQKTININH
jgi:hypothetical protein